MTNLIIVLSLLSGFLIQGCASDAKRRSQQDMIVVDQKSDRQAIVEYDGKCAMSLAEGKVHLGDSRYVLQHDGKTYYFGSAEAKQKFEQNLNDNLRHANDNWEQARASGMVPS